MLPQSQYGGHAPGALSLAHGRAHPPSTPTSPQQQPVMAAMSLLIRRWRGLSRLAATTPPSDVFFFSGAPLRRLTSASLKMLTFMTMLDIRCGRWIGPTWYTSASPTPLRPKCTQQDGRGTRRRTACQTTDVISVEGCAVGAPNRHSDYFVGLTVGRP